MNLIKANRIEWTESKSLKGKSERASQSISRAMKTQEAGHPFDRQLLRILPGNRLWPYHYHACQREI
jgi:hypothetical protein